MTLKLDYTLFLEMPMTHSILVSLKRVFIIRIRMTTGVDRLKGLHQKLELYTSLTQKQTLTLDNQLKNLPWNPNRGLPY